MAYQKIKAKKIYEEVTEVLLASITSGDLQPGDRLNSVEQLAEQLQVSRSAVREALAVIKTMGLIEIKQGSGTFVIEPPKQDLLFPFAPKLNKTDIEHLLEMRQILEIGIVSKAAQNRSDTDVTTLKNILEQMKHAYGDHELGESTDFQFHSAIAHATQNPMLEHLLAQVSETIIDIMRETRRICLYSEKTTTEQLFIQHKNIYIAIKNKDAIAAEEAMLFHLENVRATLIQHIEKN